MQISTCIRKPKNWIFMSPEEKKKWQEETNKELESDHSVDDFIKFVESSQKEKEG